MPSQYKTWTNGKLSDRALIYEKEAGQTFVFSKQVFVNQDQIPFFGRRNTIVEETH